MKKITTILLVPVVAGAAMVSLAVIGSRSPAFRQDACAAVSLDANGVGVGGTGYTVTSYNIKGAQLSAASAGMSSHKGDYSWSARGPAVARYLANINPDLVGLQEANAPLGGPAQINVIAKALPGISWVYRDRAIPIGYRTSAFTLVDHGMIQLNWGGKGGATSDRRAAWVKLRATSDGTELLYVNLHAQHMQLKKQAEARSAGWTRLINALKVINPGNDLPTVMTGDFNAASNETRAVFRDHLVKFGAAGFVDAAVSGTNVAPVARVSSYNGWGDTIGGKFYYKAINRSSSGAHIDYVWTAGKANATTWQVYTGPTTTWRTINGEQVPFTDFVPSDHWPVIAKVAIGTKNTNSPPADVTNTVQDTTTVAGYKGVQLANAQKVVAASDKLGLDDWMAAVGIMTAMGESSLINVDHGDAVRNDTIGLFQTGPEWGAYDKRMDPYEAALLFYDRLQDVPGYHQLSPTMAAHKAQRNRDANHYAKYWDGARQILAWVRKNPALAGLGNNSTDCGDEAGIVDVGPAGPLGSCPPSGSGAEHALQSTALYGLRCVKEAFPWLTSIGGRRDPRSPTCSYSDHCTGLANDFMIAKWSTPAGNARGWQLAKWVQAHAKELRVKYIIFDAKVWRAYAPERGWGRYNHPYGSSNPTLAHLDHVHVSYVSPQ